MAQKINIMDIIRFLGLIKYFIGPAVEIAEMLKEAFKSKENKFLDLALKLYGDQNAAEKALKEAVSIRDAKRREFVTRSKTDATVTQAIILKALEPYENAIIVAQRAVIDLKKKAADVYAAEAAQPSLFGLGALEDKQFKRRFKSLF